MKINRAHHLILGGSFLLATLSGCYRNEFVEPQQAGLRLKDGAVIDVVGPGRYTDSAGGWERWATFTRINASNITTSWTDTSLVTKDKQPIGLTLALTFARKTDPESVKKMYSLYHNEAIDDEALKNLVISRVPGAAKAITTQYQLDQMLGIAEGDAAIDRQTVTQQLSDLLEDELNQVYVDLATVEIADIAVSQDYLDALNAKARATVDMEVAQQQTKLKKEQLEQEKAQTQIDIEIANRENQVNAVKAQAYEDSPQLLELRKLELTANMLNKGDVIIYVPEGSDITSVLTQQSQQIVPTN